MKTRGDEFAIRHVLVAMDGSFQSIAALELATELAAAAKAELQGIFVQDDQLLRLATSPHAREVLYPAARQRPVDTASMEQALHAQAEQARKAFLTSAQCARLRWSFRVVRGNVTAEVLAAASGADVLALGKSGYSLAQGMHLGSTALAVARSAPRAVLLVHRGVRSQRQVIVLDDGSAAALDLLKAGARLADVYGNTLIVLILKSAANDGKRLENETYKAIRQARALHLRIRRLTHDNAVSIAHAVQSEGGGILLLQDGLYAPDTIKELLRRLDTPIMLVHQPE